MSNPQDAQTGNRRRLQAGLAAGAALLLALLLLGALLRGRERPLKPLRPPEPEQELVVEGASALVTFEQLEADPLAFAGRRIQVTGEFAPLSPPACPVYSGPQPRWGLTGDNLQLDVVGLEGVVRLVSAGTRLTVEGVWQVYQGPLGCGKAPPRGEAWYLLAGRILQPNPLVNAGNRLAARPGEPGLAGSATEGQPATPTPGAGATGTAGPTPTGAASPTGTPSPTPTPPGTPTSAATPTGAASPTPTASPQGTPTGAATPTAGATETAEPTPASTPTGTAGPPPPTAPPDDYPPPPPPPTPTTGGPGYP